MIVNKKRWKTNSAESNFIFPFTWNRKELKKKRKKKSRSFLNLFTNLLTEEGVVQLLTLPLSERDLSVFPLTAEDAAVFAADSLSSVLVHYMEIKYIKTIWFTVKLLTICRKKKNLHGLKDTERKTWLCISGTYMNTKKYSAT